MSYTLEEIYSLVGRDDKVAVLSFQEESKSSRVFGNEITVVFLYKQSEREHFEEKFLEKSNAETHGRIKAKYLGYELPEDTIELLKRDGINSTDIITIFHSPLPYKNPYYKEEQRKINKITLEIEKMPKGADYDWMYGFNNRLVSSGVGISPYDHEAYLAMKLFYEGDHLSSDEFAEVWNNGVLNPIIEEKYLEIKLEKDIISESEQTRLEQLWQDTITRNLKILKHELNNAGISIKKLHTENPDFYWFLVKGTAYYIPRHLNIVGVKAIYLDFQGFLHIFLRHVQEFDISEQTKNKDNFPWNPDDIIMVIKHVIASVDNEVQAFWEKEPNKRFSKFGAQSIYFEGDYYTFHIEANGRLSTFYKNRKKSVKPHLPSKRSMIDPGLKI